MPGTRHMSATRFTGPPAQEFERLNRSLPVDGRLWREDVLGSRAWAQALGAARVLTDEEVETLLEGLDRVAERLPTVLAQDPPDEDVHSLVERLLEKEVGEVAGKLRTGRSRNDQVATDVRLWGREACTGVRSLVARLQSALLARAEDEPDLLMPGYTHLQRAQPVRAAHWLLSHFWRLERDRERLATAAERAAVLPLGSGALTGCPYPVDRELLRRMLGFRVVSENSVDAVSDRDWIAEAVFALALLGVHLSGLAEDLILFSTTEFGFVRLDERVTSGSSLMPQKRNPDALELARGKAGILIGDVTSLLTVLKGLPSGYNKDLQEDKAILFHAVDAIRAVLPMMALTLETLELDGTRMAAALDESMLATDLADELAQRGVPFRETHAIVGGLVREAEIRGVSLAELAAERLERDLDGELAAGELAPAEVPCAGDISAARAPDPQQPNGVPAAFRRSADRRESAGGTGKRAVAEQIARAHRQLQIP